MKLRIISGVVLFMFAMATTSFAQDQNINGNLTVTGTSTFGTVGTGVTTTYGNTSATGNQISIIAGATASPFMSFWQSATRRGFFQFNDNGKEMKFCSQYGNVAFFTSPSGASTNRTMTVFSNSNVGIGSLLDYSTPAAAPLHIKTAGATELRLDAGATSSPFLSLYQNGTARGSVQYDNSNSTLKLASNTGGVAIYANNATPRLFIDSTGNMGVGTSSPTTKLTVAGETTTNVINITGGSDLAEQFHVRADLGLDKVEAGMVVCIDSEHPGELKVSSKPYDKTVAGVVSGAGGLQTGMRMGQQGSIADGAHAIALTGRVYCKADATRGAILPGDLLTTSARPGHAMKVADSKRGQGAIIGKAMTSLEAGKTGLVLVLVNLQ